MSVRADYRWKLVYENGETFSSEDGLPSDSPPYGIILCGQPGQDGQDLLASRDYLIYREDAERWMECDLAGLLDQLTVRAGTVSAVRVTRQVANNREFRDRYAAFLKEIRGP